MVKSHSKSIVTTADNFYGNITVDGVLDYGKSFRTVRSLHHDVARGTYLACMEFDTDAWTKQGGCLGVPIIEGLYQMPLLVAEEDPERAWFAGGFKTGHFVQKPATREVYALLEPASGTCVGDKKAIGDFKVGD